MNTKLLYMPVNNRPMQVAGFMSGSGTNLVKIIEWEKHLAVIKNKSPYKVVLIFTDNKESNAKIISEKFNIPLETFDILDFYKSKGHPDKKNLSLRKDFDIEAVKILGKYKIDLIVLAGYMSIVTKPLLEKFPAGIINVHPSDLSVKTGNKRKYTGAHAVRDAILAGEKKLNSTTHIVREEVDYGEILMISPDVQVKLPAGLSLHELTKQENKILLQEITDRHQNELKEKGDWKIFPLTIQYVAEGRFGFDEKNNLLFDNKIFNGGYRLKTEN